VVATPREAVWAYAIYALLVVAVANLSEVPLTFLGRRLVVAIPFVVFALFLPLIGGGRDVVVLGLSLSVDGLWAAWNILVKATLGLSTTVVLGATTQVAEILHGLERLHAPRVFTAIAGFMVRYADVITGEMRRMKVARESRGYEPRWFWQARALASSAGTLFIRSFERGERVHLAMLSRGYSGWVPLGVDRAATRTQWAAALLLPCVGAAVAVVAWSLA
jgi:cobalt/nickel transport system permease protein